MMQFVSHITTLAYTLISVEFFTIIVNFLTFILDIEVITLPTFYAHISFEFLTVLVLLVLDALSA